MLAYSSIENMGLLVIGTALGGVAAIAVMIHLIGHSLIKGAFFLTSGNVLEIFSTKKIKSVTGLIKADKKTGWLWVASFLGIAAFPPSILFMSEFLMIKQMFAQGRFIMCALFMLLLTIIIYGLGKAVVRMSFSAVNPEKEGEITEAVKKLNWTMYAPQIVLLVIAFVLGIYMPYDLSGFLANAVSILG